MPTDPQAESSDSAPRQDGETSPALSYDEIALRAYFIALHRDRHGHEGDPLHDWMEAEKQLGADKSSG